MPEHPYDIQEEVDMSLSDAYIEATCDGCHAVEVIPLTATAKNSWDERYVKSHLERIGWVEAGDFHYCEKCREEN